MIAIAYASLYQSLTCIFKKTCTQKIQLLNHRF